MIGMIPKGTGIFNFDGIYTTANHDFMRDEQYRKAYERAVKAQNGLDLRTYWRLHLTLWAASTCRHLEGDFVECGVNYGFHSSGIMCFLDWDTVGKTYWLMDTFKGVDLDLLTDKERSLGLDSEEHNRSYVQNVESVEMNFSEWNNVRFVVGSIPSTLIHVQAEVAYLHIDMNCTAPEIAAVNYFWDYMVPGGLVVLDDYGFPGHLEQKKAMDRFAQQRGVLIASFPTGQGLIVKPPN